MNENRITQRTKQNKKPNSKRNYSFFSGNTLAALVISRFFIPYFFSRPYYCCYPLLLMKMHLLWFFLFIVTLDFWAPIV